VGVHRKLLGATLAAVTALALTAPGASAAATCSYPASAYSSGGGAGTGAANDPLFPRQWGLDQVRAPAAWARGVRGADTTIAVIDTGVDLVHPDLQAKLVPGQDFVDGGGDCAGPQDENGHGTHVAGIAAAVTGNGVGGAGTAPDAKIMPLRALDAEGSGTDEWVVAAIRYAADHGAEVINMSLGGMPVVGNAPQLNEQLEAAAAYAWSKGAVIVAAAGNDTFPLCSYPAAAQYALCVGATDSNGNPSYYSNFPNDPDTTIGVRAPGGIGSPFCEDDEDIWSTVWPGSGFDCQGSGSHSGYDTIAGTSMASPYAAGVAALLSGSGLTNAQIMECFKQTSSKKGAYDPVYGYGIVDADAATAACAPATTAPYVPAAQPGGGSAGPGSGQATGHPAPGDGGGGGAGGGSGTSPGQDALSLEVTVLRASRAKVARSGVVRVRVTANRAIGGKLVAVLDRRPGGGLRIGGARFRLRAAGTRVVRVKLTASGRRRLLRSAGTTLRVKYATPGARGYAGSGSR
jgi:subtilisin family serine protease